jgi:hypothetical protein
MYSLTFFVVKKIISSVREVSTRFEFFQKQFAPFTEPAQTRESGVVREDILFTLTLTLICDGHL